MKKILLSCMLLFGGAAMAQVINFDDANFKYKLVTMGQNIGNWYAKDSAGNYMNVDANADGEIDQAEAQAVYQLYLYHGNWGLPLQSLAGIEYFTNLVSLEVGLNSLTTLDVSACTNLVSLNCRGNSITSLNVDGLSQLENLEIEFNPISTFAPSGLTSLTHFKARFCQLTSLDLSLFPALIFLECNNNQLTSLDATAAPLLLSIACSNNQVSNLNISGLALQHLDCSNNPLPGLDVSEFSGLIDLACENTGITEFDLTGFTVLETLYCSGNPITELNTQDLGALTYLSISNTLITELDLSHSPNIPYFDAGDNPLLTSINLHNGSLILYAGECHLGNNPNLQYICIDEGEEEVMLEYFEWHQQPPVYMSTDCTFVPGQAYNSIAGRLIYDFDGDGCDQNDVAAAHAKVVISDGTTEFVRYANDEGEYFRFAAPGDYTITPELDADLFVATPVSGSVSFPGFDENEHVQDFCITANGVHPDAEVVIVPVGGAMPGFDGVYKIILSNNGNQILSGNVSFTYDDTVLDYVSAVPSEDMISTGSLTWNYTNLLPFENRKIIIILNVNAPTDTPAVNIGDVLDFTASVTPVDTDDTPNDNNFELEQIVVGSFDPNNIICLEGEVEDVEAIGDYLHYVVNFENTGTAAATFVVITQQIDGAMFDITSLEIMGSSHNVNTTLVGNSLEFRFDAIGLGANEQGNVLFKIKSLPTLAEGDAVMNQASIVFDYNFALETNIATTVFEALMGTDPVAAPMSISVYPNPSEDVVNVNALSSIKSLELYDINGRLLQTVLVDEINATLNISSHTAGIYLLKVTTDKGSKVEKIVKE